MDSPLVAVCWQWLLARAFDVRIPPLLYLLLGLSVWCIYLADHLYDAIRTEATSDLTPRLHFTRKHFRKLLILTLLAASADFYLILHFLTKELILNGLAITLLLGGYYLLRFRPYGKLVALIPREILCGMIFGIGSSFIVFTLAASGLSRWHFFAAVFLFGLVCSASCILISIWEREADLASHDHSIATDSPRLRPILEFALNLLILLCMGMSVFGYWQVYLALALAASSLRLMLHFESQLSQNQLRALADGVLLSPLLLIAFT